jgi:nucleoside-diphosphate-sugar epimerase
MKLMVIGAQGNLGSELCRQASGPVVAVGRREWAKLTARDFRGVDAVIHAAADLHTPVSEQPSAALQSGPLVTARLLELMGEHGTPRLMCISSCAVYGTARAVEDPAHCRPVTINGQLNLLNESLIEAYCNAHGIEWEVYRLFNTFGGADRFSVVARIIAAARESKRLVIHNRGSSQRDFVHVTDVAAILLEMAARRPRFQHINVGTGQGTSISDLVAAARESHPRITAQLDDTPDPVPVSVADNGRLLACLGPRRFIPVLDTLRNTLSAPARF